MILVPKPLPTQSPLYTHRRHPSAPTTVLVHPTRTPGLLTLSKPTRPPLHRQNQRQTPKPVPKSHSAPVVLSPPAEITDIKKSGVSAVPPTPSPQPRGRGQVKHSKDNVQIQRCVNFFLIFFGLGLTIGLFSRSPSHPSVRGKHGRQPSPPFPQPQLHQISSQVEVAVFPSINSTDISDPFLDNHSSLPSNPPSPTLPSGKVAKRTQQQHTASPSHPQVHSGAIPVPAATRRQTSHISRSDPLPSHFRQRPRPISARTSTLQHFPICDDMNDTADSIVPTTPPATHRRHYDNGLQTAPISARAPGAFPFNPMGPPSPPSPVATKRGNRKHRRTPSEGVFHMSSDEDMSSGSGGIVLNPNVQALFGLVNSSKPSSNMSTSTFSTPLRSIPPYRRDSTSPSNRSLSKEKQLEREDAEKAAGYFASSMFQNSPSPDELPNPLLF